jgi:hypothetical protein
MRKPRGGSDWAVALFRFAVHGVVSRARTLFCAAMSERQPETRVTGTLFHELANTSPGGADNDRWSPTHTGDGRAAKLPLALIRTAGDVGPLPTSGQSTHRDVL